jgi:hypothetical protein
MYLAIAGLSREISSDRWKSADGRRARERHELPTRSGGRRCRIVGTPVVIATSILILSDGGES